MSGTDLARYEGPPRLVRADGTEPFVTCRRWNWRQGPRTGLTPQTTSAFFVLDALDPLTDDELDAAGDELAAHLAALGPDVRLTRRLVR